ncbi:MAG: PKD domain-containing protein [candidate division Zixibacteria bacterium]|nr:PKD domain-containing protein [candidate division Zixibacteria bacterium]
MKTCIIAVLFILLGLSAAVTADGIKQVDQPKDFPQFLGYVPDRLIVVMKPEAGKLVARMSASATAHIGNPEFDKISDQFAVSSIRQQFSGSDVKAPELASFYKIDFASGTLDEAMEAYRNNPLVERVEPIGIHAMYATPNDGYFQYQWHLSQTNDHDIDAPEGWNIQTGSTSTIVAILDSGTRYYHPDLGGVNATVSNPGASRGNMWINNAELNGSSGVDDDGNGYVDDWIGYDFIDGVSNCWTGEDCTTKDNDPRDFNGHGTHTAGIFGMITNDGYGMAGVAGGWGSGSQAEYGNGVKIMPCRMGYSYNYLGQEYGVVMMDAAAEAFYYAANNGAKIASCSWGSSNTGGIGTAATYFINSGGIIFVAAGNDGSQTADYLNGRGDCVSVAATDQNDAAASFTTYGTWVDISAPGVGIYSTYHDHTDAATTYWAALDGTSMATPMVAGVGALIWSQNPSWTAAQVKTQLYSSADNIDAYLSSTYIGKMGAGRINAYNAVNTGPPPAPVANFSGSPTSGTEPLTVAFTDASTGSITSWAWTFGDGGTSTAQNPGHTYTSAGTYNVSLTVTGPGGSDAETKTGYITVNPCVAPTAGFTGSPTSGDYPLNVTFSNSSTGATSYAWTFGDGGTSTATNPNHTYTAAGTYTVVLTATNSCGNDVFTRTNYITVTTPPCYAPVAAFVGSPTSGDFPLTVNFTDNSTNSPTSWSWTFGDGGTSTAQNPSHTYTAAGTYTVTLTATNACGSDGETKTGYITVTEPTGTWANLPYSTGFETGAFDQYWTSQSSNSEGRILITTANTPHSGSYHLTMDDNLNGGLYAQNEAWLHLNLAGKVDVDLTFWWKEFGDETHTQDGVFFSDNGGSSFTKVYSLANGTTTYQQIALDVDALASTYGLSLTGTFVVKFQQYDNYSISTDGMAFDDISVISNEVPPVAAFSAEPTSGVAPLAVTFTDASTLATSWSWNFGDGGTSTAQNPSHTYTNPGTYTVALTATNAYGSDVETKVDYITVTDPGSQTWVTITYDDFESGWGSYTDGGGDCALYTYGTYAPQGSNAANIQDNSGVSSSFYHTGSYNVTGYSELEVAFSFIAISMDNTSEDFWVQYFDGSTWQTVAALARGIDFDNNVFYNAVVTISSSEYSFPTNARLRFMCDASGNADDVYIDEIEFRGLSGTSSVNAGRMMLPDGFALSQNYPNPFNPSTTIDFSLPQAGHVDIAVYNVMGQKVATLANGEYGAGVYSIEWDGSRYASGVYFYRIQAGKFTETKKMILLK